MNLLPHITSPIFQSVTLSNRIVPSSVLSAIAIASPSPRGLKTYVRVRTLLPRADIVRMGTRTTEPSIVVKATLATAFGGV